MIRDVPVKVPEPDDFIAEYIFPSHIVVPRCSGQFKIVVPRWSGQFHIVIPRCSGQFQIAVSRCIDQFHIV